MALTDFFRINLPYGIRRNEDNEWIAFNREFRILGGRDAVDSEDHHLKSINYVRYERLTEKKLLQLSHGDEGGVKRNENGEIYMVFFYNDGSNPRNQAAEKKELWDAYFERIKILSKLEVKRQTRGNLYDDANKAKRLTEVAE